MTKEVLGSNPATSELGKDNGGKTLSYANLMGLNKHSHGGKIEYDIEANI